MKNKKIKKLVLLVVAIITIVGLGGLFAYLSDTDQKTNVFTLGKIDIELTETNWNPSNAQNVLPGQPIPKNPTINNIGRNSAYVYIKVVNPIVELTSGEGVLFNYTINSGWTKLDEQEQCGYKSTTYYYNNALNASSSTNALFDNVTINDYSDNVGEEQLLDIYAYGIQSTYLNEGATVQSIFSDAFTSTLNDTGLCPKTITEIASEFDKYGVDGTLTWWIDESDGTLYYAPTDGISGRHSSSTGTRPAAQYQNIVTRIVCLEGVTIGQESMDSYLLGGYYTWPNLTVVDVSRANVGTGWQFSQIERVLNSHESLTFLMPLNRTLSDSHPHINVSGTTPYWYATNESTGITVDYTIGGTARSILNYEVGVRDWNTVVPDGVWLVHNIRTTD